MLRLANVVVQIPMSGAVESPNLGAAAGISLCELKTRMVLSMFTRYIRATLGRQVKSRDSSLSAPSTPSWKKVSDLGSTRVIPMMVLECDGVMSLDQVPKDTVVFGQELDELLRPLSERGYLRHASDKEAPAGLNGPSMEAIVLTEAGERTLGQLWGVVEKAERELPADFSDAEKRQLDDLLEWVQSNCSRLIGESPAEDHGSRPNPA